MTPEEEISELDQIISELDQMVNDRDDLIRALHGECDLTGDQKNLLERICSE